MISAFQDPHAEELKLEKKHAEEKKAADAVKAVAGPSPKQLAAQKTQKVGLKTNGSSASLTSGARSPLLHIHVHSSRSI